MDRVSNGGKMAGTLHSWPVARRQPIDRVSLLSSILIRIAIINILCYPIACPLKSPA